MVRRLIAICLMILVAVPAHAQARRRAHGGLQVPVARPVTITVENVNRSAQPCSADGKAHAVRGTLVIPAGAVPAGVTLYLHGSGDGATWHFTQVPGHDMITEMARLGHASVFIDQLGYGASDIPDGNQVCVGSLADMAAQIAGDLRSGDYAIDLVPTPQFARVALAGHSLGGAIAELASYSFPDAFDALLLVGWVSSITPQTSSKGQGAQGAVGPGAARGILVGCSTPGPKRPGSASGGYATVFNRDEIAHIFVDAEQEVVDRFSDVYEADACGAAHSIGGEFATAQVGLPQVTVPVLIVLGEHDISGPTGAEAERVRLTSSRDVGIYIVPSSGHMMMLERNAATFRATLSDWLSRRGF